VTPQQRVIPFSLFVTLSINAASQVPASRARLLLPREPTPNLGELKKRFIAYHDRKENYCYEAEINRQCERALRFLTLRVKHNPSGAKLALILDMDETALSNWSYETQEDFHTSPEISMSG
jgi:hypothetical protein